MIAPKGSSEAFLRANVDYNGKGCLIWPFSTNAAGYGLAVIDGFQTLASRWMCILVHGEPPSPCHEAAHRCGNGHNGCVHPKHLRWATPKQNSADKEEHGTAIRGERNGKTALTADDIRAIRAAPADLNVLVEQYSVSKGCIVKIRNGTRWGHVQ